MVVSKTVEEDKVKTNVKIVSVFGSDGSLLDARVFKKEDPIVFSEIEGLVLDEDLSLTELEVWCEDRGYTTSVTETVINTPITYTKVTRTTFFSVYDPETGRFFNGESFQEKFFVPSEAFGVGFCGTDVELVEWCSIKGLKIYFKLGRAQKITWR